MFNLKEKDLSGSPIPRGGTRPQSWSAVMLSNGAKQGLFPILPACSLGEKELQMTDVNTEVSFDKHCHKSSSTNLTAKCFLFGWLVF